jgi:dynein heavy chain, axonemal
MVTEVQYGGRITDDLDRELFITYGQQWLTEAVFQPNYIFNTTFTEFHYAIPDSSEHGKFMEAIGSMPVKDSPIIFGLHPNADLTYRLNESIAMLTTLIDTQPKEASGGSGKSREDEVKEKIEKELLPQLPPDFIEAEIEERLKTLRGPKGLSETGKGIPLNVFLFQELQRFQTILSIVRRTLVNMVLAIEGSIIMTPDLVEAIDSVYDFRVPRPWTFDPTGAEIAWLCPSLSGWMKGLNDRHFQLNGWISKERPQSFWLTGFFNPQGFLTSMKQEVTRQRKAQQWSLDEVEYQTEVTKDVIQGDDGRIEGKQLQVPGEGVLIHGLYLEGAGWNKGEKRLEESQPKELFYTFPIIHVFAISTAPVTGPGAGAKAKQDDRGGEKQMFSCPVYKYPKRNDKYLIFRVMLKCDVPGGTNALPKGVTPPMKWKMQGVALLCSKE